MLVRQVLLAFIGMSAGLIVSGGLFSFLVSLGVIADLADRTHTGKAILFYEDAAILGGTIGNVLYLYEIGIPGGKVMLGALGMLTGVFVGCEIMALAEILNLFPIFIRRMKLIKAMPYVVLAVALGKGIGEVLFAILGW